MKKIMCILLIMSLIIQITSCKNSDPCEDKQYMSNEIASNIKIDLVYNFSQYEDKLIIIGQEQIGYENQTDDDPQTEYMKVVIFNEDGMLLKEILLDDQNSTLISFSIKKAATIDREGNIWILHDVYIDNVGTVTRLECYDIEGSHLKTIQPEQFNYQYDITFSSMEIGNDGCFYFNIDNEVIVYDENGKLLLTITDKNGWRTRRLNKLYDGRIIVDSFSSDKPIGMTLAFRELEVKSKGLGQEWKYDFDFSGTFFYGNGNNEYDLLLCTKDTVYGYNIFTGIQTELIKWSEHGIDNSNMNMFKHVIVSSENVYGIKYNQNKPESLMDGSINIYKLSKTNLLDKNNINKTINLSTLYLTDSMRDIITEFNNNKSNYKIEVKTYTTEGNNASYSDSIDRFNSDIISGNIPDFIILDECMPIKSYIQKGLFIDLYKHIDIDPEIDRKDYLPNILKAFESDGKLYTCFTSFSIGTLIGKTSDVGNTPGWTWSDFNKLLSSKPKNTIPIADNYIPFTKQRFLGFALLTKINEYIDYDSASCSFENDDFKDLLKLADNYPSETIEIINPSAYKDGNPLLMYTNVSLYDNLKSYEVINFGEEITFIGFPSNGEESIGIVGYAYNQFAIPTNAKEANGAWEFAKYLLSDYQKKCGSTTGYAGFPIKISSLEILANKAKEELPNGRLREAFVEDGDNVFTVEFGANTDEDNKKISDLIYSVSNFTRNNSDIISIISEETESFFVGQKSVEEVASIIQNRVSTYLSEIS